VHCNNCKKEKGEEEWSSILATGCCEKCRKLIRMTPILIMVAATKTMDRVFGGLK